MKYNFLSKLFNFAVLLSVFALLTNGQEISRLKAFAQKALFPTPTNDLPGPVRNYTGIRVKSDSQLLVYYYEQTVALVEVTDTREMLNCELLEVRTKADLKATLLFLRSVAPLQTRISFTNMKDLMEECQKVEPQVKFDQSFFNGDEKDRNPINPNELKSLFKGVLPGTKWCGAGDLAGSYYDLGIEKGLDKCCRTHDFCPIKVSGLKTQFNITNYSLYTKVHCDCERNFYNCMKNLDTTMSNFLGNFYFNLRKVTCIDHNPTGENPNNKDFVTFNQRY